VPESAQSVFDASQVVQFVVNNGDHKFRFEFRQPGAIAPPGQEGWREAPGW
jgi:hypothetical protein